MKKKVSVLFLCCYLFLLVGCGKKIDLELPDNAIEYIARDNEELDCFELVYDGKVYRPYGIAEPSQVNSVIGYYERTYGENDIRMNYVLSVKGQSPDEWLITAGDDGSGYVNGCNIGGVWKEINVTSIPNGIEKETEYEWNN